MQYRLSAEIWGQVFAVPAAVVDRHIKLCGSSALKLLLLILRSPDQQFDEHELASRLGIPNADAADALNYWVESGVLEVKDIKALKAPKETAKGPEKAPLVEKLAALPAPAPEKLQKAAPPSRPRYPREESVDIIEKDKVLSALMQEAQHVMGKTFTSADMDSLVGMYSYYGLSPHYIITLLHYCASIGKRSMGYAESVSVGWMNEGVDDATVDRQVDALLRRRTYEGKVRGVFGIDRNLVPKEREMIACWFDTWHFDLDMVTLAYEISVERIGKLALRYIHKILESWHQQGIRTPQEAKEEPKSAPKERTLGSKYIDKFMKE